MKRMGGTRRCSIAILAAFTALVAPALAAEDNALEPGTQAIIRINDYPSIAEAPAMMPRVLSPLAVEAARRKLRSSNMQLERQTFDIRREEFVVYVPRRQPPGGYGLLVFVPPWPQAQIPPGWTEALDQFGVIFVSASGSGNEAKVLERRIPLALVALANMRARFSIDPNRTMIGGFSGGARVALRIALAYPDLFVGVFLNAGSDPIGRTPNQLPDPNLLELFQTRTKLAFVTGDEDAGSASLDDASRSSLSHWCVSNVSSRSEHGAGHEVATAAGLEWAFRTIFGPTTDPDRSAACRASRRDEVDRELARLRREIAAAPPVQARRLLWEFDAKYGGLAGSQSIALAEECNCGIFVSASAKLTP